MSPVPPTIAIVGRPNVGKSTLFNRLVGHRSAIVHDTPGVTRDRHYELCERYARPFWIVDTGGLEPGAEDDLFRVVRRQAMAAVEEADLVLFVVDGRTGLSPVDSEVAQLLRARHPRVLLVVNKVEGVRQVEDSAEFHALGLGDLHLISAEHDRGVGDLVELALGLLPAEEAPEEAPAAIEEEEPDDEDLDDDDEDLDDDDEDLDDEDLDDEDEDLDDEDPEPDPDAAELEAPAAPRRARRLPEPVPEEPSGPAEIRIAILGRPNAGKSTLVNRLLGEDRQVVSDIPGTTMDAIDLPLDVDGQRMVLVDTAGVRRKSRVVEGLEGYAVSRSIHAIERCHISLVLIDGSEGVTDQDARLVDLVIDRGRGLILLVNKWDKVRQDPDRNVRVVEDELARRLPHARWAPVLYISALTGKGCTRIFDLVRETYRELDRRLSTAECNRFLLGAVAAHSIPQRYNRPVRIHYMTQVRVRPPTFTLFSNTPEGVDESWKRFLSNRLRETYGFQGAPIRLNVRRKRRPGEAPEED